MLFYLPIALTALATTLYHIAQKSIVPGVHPMVSLVITYATQPRLGGRERDDRAAARVSRRRRLSGAPGGATRGGVAQVPGGTGPRRPAVASASASCTAWSTARRSSGPGFPSGNCALVAYTPLATTVAPRLAHTGRSAYPPSMRDWDVLDGLPEIPTAATPLVESLTPARSSSPTGPASPWRRPGGVASLGRRDASCPRPPRPAALAECPGARGGESRPAGGRSVLPLGGVRDPAAFLARERDPWRVQCLAHARGSAADRTDVGGEALHDPVLHVPLRHVRHRARGLRAHAVRGRGRVCREGISHAGDIRARDSGRGGRPGSLGARAS